MGKTQWHRARVSNNSRQGITDIPYSWQLHCFVCKSFQGIGTLFLGLLLFSGRRNYRNQSPYPFVCCRMHSKHCDFRFGRNMQPLYHFNVIDACYFFVYGNAYSMNGLTRALYACGFNQCTCCRYVYFVPEIRFIFLFSVATMFNRSFQLSLP